ncbi:MAG: hypothetical protein OEZ68_11980 [Gammaproteobacteria bacterium]|nr:hypothetical protein [Gammaproteobacteria bacterium]MDH5801512.1 hypothetical protein [Gammaproteobacteria bacterium]
MANGADFFQFFWPVHENGYVWRDARKDMEGNTSMEPYLTLKKPLTDQRMYEPLTKKSGLFRTFASLRPTKSEIANFANRYGMLGGDVDAFIVPDASPSPVEVGESLSKWKNEIILMKNALTLWDFAMLNDRKGLAQHIVWEGTGMIKCRMTRFRGCVASRELRAHLLEKFALGDLVKPALYQVNLFINESIKSRVTLRNMWDQDYKHHNLHALPNGLIGALWLQFANAFNGTKQFRQCSCGEWFEISPPITRKTRKHCSSACKQKAYRSKKEITQ